MRFGEAQGSLWKIWRGAQRCLRYLWEGSGVGGSGMACGSMAMSSALPWVAPASHLNFLNCSACRPALLSPFVHAPSLWRGYHVQRSLPSARRIFPPLCRLLRRDRRCLLQGIVGGRIWSRRLGFQPLEWAKGRKLQFSLVSSSKNLNANTNKDEMVSIPMLENLRVSEVRRVIGRDEQEDELDSESDDEEDGIYYDGGEDGLDDIDREFEDNEEDAEATSVVKVASEGSESSGEDRERLKELCARVQASGERTVTAGDIAGLYDFQFDKFQVWSSVFHSLQQWLALLFWGFIIYWNVSIC